MRSYLSVIIPTYNEEKNLKRGVLNEVYDYLKKQNYSWEVLIVNDGSTDLTAKNASEFVSRHSGFKLINEPHRGKGGTVIAGMLRGEGEILLFCDFDQATPISELSKVLPKFSGKEGKAYDVVIGSRAGRKGAPLLRKLMAYGFAFLRTIILGLPYKDTQCGFKAFKKEAAKEIFKRMEIFSKRTSVAGAAVTAGFDLELLYIARKLGLRVAEVNVEWRHKETERINPIKDSWEGFRDLMRVRLNALLGRYKI